MSQLSTVLIFSLHPNFDSRFLPRLLVIFTCGNYEMFVYSAKEPNTASYCSGMIHM